MVFRPVQTVLQARVQLAAQQIAFVTQDSMDLHSLTLPRHIQIVLHAAKTSSQIGNQHYFQNVIVHKVNY